MRNLYVINLTHGNLDKAVSVAVPLAFAWFHSPGSNCTHIYASGGSVIPVKESPEEVTRLIEAAYEASNNKENK
jgi:hypothetical protein